MYEVIEQQPSQKVFFKNKTHVGLPLQKKVNYPQAILRSGSRRLDNYKNRTLPKQGSISAESESRTRKPVKAHASETCAFTNSAIPAL